jgi:UDP-4-amino-4,6-dideoxy-N-acetyl-beta-L-altrosamine N-acetyltransferase
MKDCATFKSLTSADKATIELVRTWRNSQDVKRYMLSDHTISPEEHGEYLKGLKKRDDAKAWVVYCGIEPVGFAQLSRIDRKNRNAEWGVYIGDNKMRGKGIGSLAVIGLMRYAFEELMLQRIHTKVLGNNLSAIKLYEKLGFKEEGRLRKDLLREGEYIDVVIMGLLKEEWDAIKQRRDNDIIMFE